AGQPAKTSLLGIRWPCRLCNLGPPSVSVGGEAASAVSLLPEYAGVASVAVGNSPLAGPSSGCVRVPNPFPGPPVLRPFGAGFTRLGSGFCALFWRRRSLPVTA